jgi:hypothetical protein
MLVCLPVPPTAASADVATHLSSARKQFALTSFVLLLIKASRLQQEEAEVVVCVMERKLVSLQGA